MSSTDAEGRKRGRGLRKKMPSAKLTANDIVCNSDDNEGSDDSTILPHPRGTTKLCHFIHVFSSALLLFIS